MDTDYYFVSLGTDEANISTANMIKRYVGQHHIAREDALRAVICYVVFAPELAQTLNRKKRYCFTADKADIYMNAVGSLEDVYSVRNVFMTEHETVARKAHSDYLSRQGGEQRAKIHKKRIANDYNHWANLARAMHIKYKVFSMGMLETSVLDYTDATEKDYGKYLEQALEKYKKAVSGQMRFDDPKEAEAFVALLHRMSWLEHRRWCAFTRVKGFQSTQNYDRYVVAGKKGSYKQMELKLHPCLVECDQKGIRAAVAANGQIDPDTILKCTDESDFDLLDELTYALYRAGHNQYDFKQYDYPFSDF